MLHLFLFITVSLATLAGGGSISHMFGSFYIVVMVLIIIAGVIALRLFAWAGLGAYSWLPYLGVIAFSYILGATFRFWALDLPTYEVTDNIPVKVEVIHFDGRATGNVRISNQHKDPMLSAGVACRIFHDDGSPVGQLFKGGFGRLAQIDTGLAGTTAVVSRLEFEKYRSDPDTMQCWATNAKFVSALKLKLDLRFERNEGDGKTDFYVTNEDTVPATNIQFNCVTHRNEPVKVAAYPAYQPNQFQITTVEPGKTVKFVSDNAVWRFRSCRISNAAAAP